MDMDKRDNKTAFLDGFDFPRASLALKIDFLVRPEIGNSLECYFVQIRTIIVSLEFSY